jgi:hypothetical protein
MPLDGFQLRFALLEICEKSSSQGPGYFQSGGILKGLARQLNARSLEDEQAILTAWADLFRLGILAPGYNLTNPDPPFVHLTEVGRRTLSHLSSDPSNPDGYLAVVRPALANFPVALSYIEEGVHAFQAGCFKSTAVMTGAAAESLVLSVRDALGAARNAASSWPITAPSRRGSLLRRGLQDTGKTWYFSRRAEPDRSLPRARGRRQVAMRQCRARPCLRREADRASHAAAADRH